MVASPATTVHLLHTKAIIWKGPNPKGKETLVEQSENWLARWCLHCCLLMDHHKGSKRALTQLSMLSWESSECAFFLFAAVRLMSSPAHLMLRTL